MALFDWNEKFSVNVREIDDQHKVLVNYLNNLWDAMKNGKGRNVLGEVLDGMIRYTFIHFATEEKYMQKFGYPDFGTHKIEHDKLTQKAIEIQKHFQEAPGEVTLTIETMKFLKDWLSKHILVTDKKYSSFFNENGLI